jgi:hypothetical protein
MESIVSCLPKKNNKFFPVEIKTNEIPKKEKYKFIHTYKIYNNRNSYCEKSFHNIQQNERTILYLLSTYKK